MPMVFLRSIVTGRPGWVVVFWVAVAGAMGFFAPNLTRLAAEGQANLLGADAESRARARRCVGRGQTRRMSRSWSPPFTALAG